MTSNTAPQSSETRLTSGIAGLDRILRGGFLRTGIYLVMGTPGAGKTIFGNQVCFHHVALGQQAVYLTLLAENHASMITHMEGFTFFDPNVIGRSLHYFSGYSDLDEGGVPALLALIQHILRDYTPTVLIIDGFSAVELRAESDLERKRFINQLQLLGATYGCTTFLLTHATCGQLRPEHTMVDGIIELSDTLVDRLAARELHVRKLRGTAELRGKHVFEITDTGIVVYPRTEAVLAPTLKDYSVNSQRRMFNIGHLDTMLRGGLPVQSSTVLLGTTGSGKTLLCLHFLVAGAQRGEPGLYLGFAETASELIGKAQQVGLDLATSVAADQIMLLWQPMIDGILDKLVEQVLLLVEQRRIQRICIDGLEGLQEAAIHQERLHRVLVALVQTLQARGVTTIFTAELHEPIGLSIIMPIIGASAIAGNIIVTRHVEVQSQVRLVIAILKMRQSGYDPTIREMRITEQGIVVMDLPTSTDSVLTGTAHPH